MQKVRVSALKVGSRGPGLGPVARIRSLYRKTTERSRFGLALDRTFAGMRCSADDRVEAGATMRPGATVVRRLDTLPERSDLPDTVVRYVLRTHETVLLDDAHSPNPFSTDPHVAEHRVRSLLCLPLVNRGTLIGALYFEDRTALPVFTPSRIGILRLLASQAAIALENARL